MNAGAAHPTHSEPAGLPASGSSGRDVGVGDGGGVGLGVFLVGGEGVSVGVAVGVSVGDEGVLVAVAVDVSVAVAVGVTPRATPLPSLATWLLLLTVISSVIAQAAFAMELDAPTMLINKTTTLVTIKLFFIFHLTWAIDL